MRSRRGFTLVEMMIALGLLAVILVKLTMVIEEARRSHRVELGSMALEDRARQVLDRIAFALAGADRATLQPALAAPGFQNQIEYTISLGVDDEGTPVWGAPEIIGVSGDGEQVFWAENPGQAEERRVVWCNAVREFFEGEFPNGFDDNENGLNDEGGLNFVVDGDSVEIGLTLERELTGEGPITKTVETLITCRN